jgi:hypothetical protein
VWTKLEILIPIIAIVVSSIASFIGARIGRKDLLNQATDVLNEQGDEAILQYKVIKALLNVMLSIIDSLSKAKVINGDGAPLRKEVQAVQDMLENDVVKRKEKMLYVRSKWRRN